MDIEAFRSHFPEFSDDSAYPDSMISFWSGLAESRMPSTRWGNLWGPGVELYTAHSLVLAKKNQTGTPGQSNGPITSKSVGPLSASFDTGAVTIEGAGEWNATSYGRQWKQLANIAGMGGVQLT